MHDDDLIEAIAWWRIGDADGRRVLVKAATDSLVNGSDSDALAELAGISDRENPFAVDALVARVVEDLALESALDSGVDLIAARRLCRAALSGETSERELTRWVHNYFHHESSSDLINRLAELDDDFDLAHDGIRGSASAVAAHVREVAAQIVDLT